VNEEIIQEEFNYSEQELQQFLDKVDYITEILMDETELPIQKCERVACVIVHKLHMKFERGKDEG